jgi:ribose-phosphate pyrophosphokinase
MFPAASDSNRLRLFSGSANVSLAQGGRYLGMDVGQMIRKRFADGELYIQIQESIRGCDVYLIQPCCNPVNDHLMELLIMIDACRRASARQITAVIPYYGYARADRKTAGRESIAAKLVANLITEAGQVACWPWICIQPKFKVISIFPSITFMVPQWWWTIFSVKNYPISSWFLPMWVGWLGRGLLPKNSSDAPLAIIDKRRQTHNVAEVMNLIGDVKDKTAVLVDDMIDTAGTIAEGAQLLKAKGARQVYACATHPVFSGSANQAFIQWYSRGSDRY